MHIKSPYQIQYNDGFTLVELLVTILFIGIVFVGLSNIFIGIQKTQIQTSYLNSATYAAQRQIESLRNSNYNNLETGQTINFTDQLPENLPNNSIGTAQITEPTPGLKRVDVTISYTYSGSSRNVNLSSLIGAIGIVQ